MITFWDSGVKVLFETRLVCRRPGDSCPNLSVQHNQSELLKRILGAERATGALAIVNDHAYRFGINWRGLRVVWRAEYRRNNFGIFFSQRAHQEPRDPEAGPRV